MLGDVLTNQLHTMNHALQTTVNQLNDDQVLALLSSWIGTFEWAHRKGAVPEYLDSMNLSVADAYALIDITCGPGEECSRLQSMLVR